MDTNKNSCYDIPGANVMSTPGTGGRGGTRLADTQGNYRLGNCEVEVCGDGEVVSGSYCGILSCNMAGCDCEGGCLPGNPVQFFKQTYGHIAKNVYIKPGFFESIGMLGRVIFRGEYPRSN